MSTEFYLAFEDRHRGNRELIKSRLEQYLPFIEPLKASTDIASAVDLGCGRGEWLELLGEHGVSAIGVDMDEGMLSACYERNLSAEHGDAIALLESLADESVNLVSGFHIIEHISFDSLRRLVAEALRVLKPAGILILETPNPENLVVATCNFYMDPTHERPIPPQLLEFLIDYAGFGRGKVLRLQEPSGISSKELTLIDVLQGVSPDYAVVAQKGADEELLAAFNSPFEQEYGVSLTSLAVKYEQQNVEKGELIRWRSIAAHLEGELAKSHTQHEKYAELNGQLECTLQAANGQIDTLLVEKAAREVELQEARRSVESLTAQLNAKSEEFDAAKVEFDRVGRELDAVYSSKSWLITWPLRGTVKILSVFLRLARRLVGLILGKMMAFVLARPQLTKLGLALFDAAPGLKVRLKPFAISRGIIKLEPTEGEDSAKDEDLLASRSSRLTPEARKIYMRISAELESARKEFH